MLSFPIASMRLASEGSPLKSERWYLRTMWIRKLTKNAAIAETRIGSQRDVSDTMTTSRFGWRAGCQDRWTLRLQHARKDGVHFTQVIVKGKDRGQARGVDT